MRNGLISRVRSYVDIHAPADELHQTGVSGLAVFRTYKPTPLKPSIYQPMFCLVLQGSKEVHVGPKNIAFSSGESLVVTHDVPMVSRITEASNDKPYLALSLPVDLNTVRSLVNDINEAEIDQKRGQTLSVDRTDEPIIDAMARLFDLVEKPIEAKVIAPLIVKEVYFRLLLAPHGAMLRRLLQQGSHASRISKVITFIKKNYAQSFTVAELADIATMSLSSFHEYFKEITSTTPLQYQKEIRLLEARRLLADLGHTVSEAAFEVGYQSPTQFSREYSRKFGTAPSMDKNSAVYS